MRYSLCTWVMLFGAGCGLLEVTQGITISLPSQDFPFSVDVTGARSQIEQAIEQALQLPSGTLDLQGDEIPAQVCNPPGSGNCVDVPRIQKDFTFDVPPQSIDMRSQTELKKYVDAGKVKAVKIKYINFTIVTNTLNFDLPAVEVYVDDLGATVIDENTSDKVGVIPSLPAGQTGQGKVQFTTQGQAIISDRLLDFAFSMLGRVLFSIDTEVTRSIPTGVLAGSVQIGVEFTVDPI